MSCTTLMAGLDLSCNTDFKNKYYQNCVLINKSDVDQYQVSTSDTVHRVQFTLTAGATGYLYMSNENKSLISGSFGKTDRKGIPYYNHKVNIPISGTSEAVKIILKKLDLSEYFAVLQFKNEDVEVYGFENGLKTDGYDYQPQSGLGGANLGLVSKYDEYEPPYIYYSDDPTGDFNNLFEGLADFLNGDFNNDYSDDFYIIGA